MQLCANYVIQTCMYECTCMHVWLSVVMRCQFILLTITFKSVHGDAPEYLQNLLNRYRPRRQLDL